MTPSDLRTRSGEELIGPGEFTVFNNSEAVMYSSAQPICSIQDNVKNPHMSNISPSE